jgi:uncharacterized membrane protein YraQ (UPF0718 family)
MGIYQRGAGLGPAIAFLYSGPAINVLAIILTARILGLELGLARAIGAVVFSIIIGLLMHLFFLKEERKRHSGEDFDFSNAREVHSLGKTIPYFFSMVAILVFANWGKPPEESNSFWWLIYQYKWWITGLFVISLSGMLIKWFNKNELKEWTQQSWVLALQILPSFWAASSQPGFYLEESDMKGLSRRSILLLLWGVILCLPISFLL